MKIWIKSIKILAVQIGYPRNDKDLSIYDILFPTFKYIRDKYGMLLKSNIIQENACDHAESSYWYISIFDNLIAVLNSLKNALESGFLNDGYDGETNLLKNVSSRDYYASRITKLIDALEDLQYEDNKEVAYTKLRKLLSNNELSEKVSLSSKSSELISLINKMNERDNYLY